MSRSHTARFALTWAFTSTTANLIFSILSIAVLARLLTPYDFGVFGAASLLVLFAELACDFGIGTAIIQAKQTSSYLIASSRIASLFTCSIITASIYFFAPLISTFLSVPELVSVIPVQAIGIFLSGMSVVPRSILTRTLNFRAIAFIDGASYLFGYCAFSVLFAVLDAGYWALVYGYLIQAALRCGLSYVFAPSYHINSFKWSVAIDLVLTGAGNTVSALANFVANQGERVIISRFLGAEALGNYSRAYQLSIMPTNALTGAFASVLFPSIAGMHASPGHVSATYKLAMTAVFATTLPLLVFICVLAPEIIAVVLGPQWMAISELLCILSVTLPFRMSQKVADAVAKGLNASGSRAWRQVVYASAVLLGARTGATFGIDTVTVLVACATFVNFVLMTHLCYTLTFVRIREIVKTATIGVRLSLCVLAVVYSSAFIFRLLLDNAFVTVLGSVAVLTVLALCIMKYHAKLFFGTQGLALLHSLVSSLPSNLAIHAKTFLQRMPD